MKVQKYVMFLSFSSPSPFSFAFFSLHLPWFPSPALVPSTSSFSNLRPHALRYFLSSHSPSHLHLTPSAIFVHRPCVSYPLALSCPLILPYIHTQAPCAIFRAVEFPYTFIPSASAPCAHILAPVLSPPPPPRFSSALTSCAIFRAVEYPCTFLPSAFAPCAISLSHPFILAPKWNRNIIHVFVARNRRNFCNSLLI